VTDTSYAAAADTIISACNIASAWSAHVKVCAALKEQQVTVSDGVMALLWTAVHELSQGGMSQANAHAILIEILKCGPGL
jgi:hypothetical protein